MADQTCRQPSLDEILADPLTVLLMQSDGVDPADVRLLLRNAQAARLSRDEDGTEDSADPVKSPAWMQPLTAIRSVPGLDALCRCRA